MCVIGLRRRHVFGVVFVLLAGTLVWQLLLLGQNLVTAFRPVTDWGLGFGEQGTQPRGNVDAQTLSQYNALYIGNPGDKVLYLTFDAGYENGYTDEILDVLKKRGVKAAFFLVGNYVRDNPELSRRMAEEGHTVGNHTFSHPDMSAISDPDKFKKELEQLEDLFFETTGKAMSKYYRPPSGKFSEKNLAMAKELGYTTVFWSLAYVDWDTNNQPTQEAAYDILLSRVHDGAVVLLHCVSRTNAEILDSLISQWQDMGYRFGTLDELCVSLALGQ